MTAGSVEQLLAIVEDEIRRKTNGANVHSMASIAQGVRASRNMIRIVAAEDDMRGISGEVFKGVAALVSSFRTAAKDGRLTNGELSEWMELHDEVCRSLSHMRNYVRELAKDGMRG